MTRVITKISEKRGLAPGSLIHIGEKKTEATQISLIRYTNDAVEEKLIDRIEELVPSAEVDGKNWININGVHDASVIEKLGRLFNIHPLTLEDIMNTGQRPKTEEFDEYLYVVFKMMYFDDPEKEIVSEQVSLIVGRDYLLSFQEVEKDVFSTVRERIRKARGRFLKAGTDYLAYCLLDAVVDQYFALLEIIGEKIEILEDEILSFPSSGTLERVQAIKREMIVMRKQIWPMREMINAFEKVENSLVHKSTRVYLRDVYDHTIQVIDTLESYRDILAGMLDIYLSSVSNRMNEVMKVLTVIATIFIPITFVAGVYGMNFRYMPELDWKWGYPAIWLLMAAVVVVMLMFFRKKTWL